MGLQPHGYESRKSQSSHQSLLFQSLGVMTVKVAAIQGGEIKQTFGGLILPFRATHLGHRVGH